MIKYFFLLLFLFSGLFTQAVYSQKRKSNGLVSGRGGDPFTGRRNPAKIKLHYSGKKQKTENQLIKGSKRKAYSLKSNQTKNRNAYKGNRAARGLGKQYNVSSDAFSRKSKKKYKATGQRGESRYKKKSRNFLKLGSNKGHETRRMEKSNKKSFKK